METGGLSKRHVNIADKALGHTIGGLGTDTVVACLFFGPSPLRSRDGGRHRRHHDPLYEEGGIRQTYATGLSAVGEA